jgi:hypothetical protein
MNRKTPEIEKQKRKSAHTHTCVSQVLLLHSPASSSPGFCRLRASQSPAAAAFTKSAPRFRDSGPISWFQSQSRTANTMCERDEKLCDQWILFAITSGNFTKSAPVSAILEQFQWFQSQSWGQIWDQFREKSQSWQKKTKEKCRRSVSLR